MAKENSVKLDPELEDLLSNALEDFDLNSSKGKNENKEKDEKVEESKSKESEWSEEFLQNAALNFEKNFQSLLNDENGLDELTPEKLSQDLEKFALAAGIEGKNTPEEFSAFISETLQNLSETTNGLEEEDIPNILNNAGNEEFFPLVQQMMQSLLSKEILYPALKEMLDKYPAWLEEKRSTLECSDYERYKKQLDLMKVLCEELEKEQSTDGEEVKKKRFQTILDLMGKMQECGQPPKELMNDYSAFNFNPLNENSLQQCSLM